MIFFINFSDVKIVIEVSFFFFKYWFGSNIILVGEYIVLIYLLVFLFILSYGFFFLVMLKNFNNYLLYVIMIRLYLFNFCY